MLAILTVSVDDDGVIAPNDGDLTLREAIAYVNLEQVPQAGDLAHISGSIGVPGVIDTIVFSTMDGVNQNGAPISNLDGATILLTQGELTITESVTIDATALGNGLTVDAGNGFNGIAGDGDGTSVFAINTTPCGAQCAQSTDVTLAGLTITGGDTNGNGGGVRVFGFTNQPENVFLALTIQDSTITGNYADGNGGGLYIPTGFYVPVDLVVERSTISDNHAGSLGGNGGGLHFTAFGSTATISESVISGNTAGDKGGGIYAYNNTRGYGDGSGDYSNVSPSLLTISKSTISNNEAGTDGGGIFSDITGADNRILGTTDPPDPAVSDLAKVVIKDSTISGNRAGTLDPPSGVNTPRGRGGGAYVCIKFGGTLNVTNSTISGNGALDGRAFNGTTDSARGGGLYVSYPSGGNLIGISLTTISSTTITDNFASDGGGLYSADSPSFETTLTNTIVSGNRVAADPNSAADNIAGAIEADSSYNLIGTGTATDPTGPGNLFDDDPGLRDLDFYGGPTQTHMPDETSPVINTGDPSFDVNGPDGVAFTDDDLRYDQRGRPFKRVFDADGDPNTTDIIDIGAVEYGLGDPDKPPEVIDVVISGSNSVHADYSFSEALGQGINQLTTVPVGGADTIEVVFSEWVNVDASDLWLKGYHTGIQYNEAYADPFSSVPNWNVVDFAFDDETFIARWRFDDPADIDTDPNPFPADKLVFAMNYYSGNFITDVDGIQLDGAGVFVPDVNSVLSPNDIPQGDGSAGDMFYFQFVILPGDNDLTNTVSGSGFLWWQTHFNPDSTDSTFIDGDFDGDGDVDGADLSLWQASFGLNFTTWF